MSEIVKVCETHGSLTIDQVYEESMNNGLTFRLRCKECRLDYEIKNKEKRLAYSREYERTKRKRPSGWNEIHNERYRDKARERRQKNAETINERIREDRKINPEKYREYDRKWRRENLLKSRELDVVQKHNITYDSYKWMAEKQNGKCEICGKEETRKSRTNGQICRLTIDHDHETGLVRDLLCHNCNVLVGHCKESEELLDKAKQYVSKHKNRKKIYYDLLKQQNKKCACCKEEKFLVFDFYGNDESKVKALICHNCKDLMLFANNDISKLERSIEFVEKFKPTRLINENGLHIWELKHNTKDGLTLENQHE